MRDRPGRAAPAGKMAKYRQISRNKYLFTATIYTKFTPLLVKLQSNYAAAMAREASRTPGGWIVRFGPGAGRDVRAGKTEMDCASESGVIADGAGALPGARRRCEAGKRTHGPGTRACLALLAAAALLALAAPAQAQTAVLISNFNQAEALGVNVPVVSTIQQIAQGFTTGSSPATLTSIDLRFYAPDATTELPSMTLHSGTPRGTQVASLTSSGSLPAGMRTIIPTPYRRTPRSPERRPIFW